MSLVTAALAMGGLLGCAAGSIRGRVTMPGQEPEPVTLRYESSVFGRTGRLSTTLPNGERFSGTYVLVPDAPDHQMTSTLSGDRGTSMFCRFKLNEPGVGPDGGGTAQCQLSTGGTIEAWF